MRNTLCAVALLSIAFVGAGCKKGPSLVGKWTGAVQGPAAASGATATYEFKDGGGFVLTTGQGQASVSISGDYTQDKENLTVNMKDIKLTGIPKQFEAMAKSQFKTMTSKPLKAKVTFVTDDSISFLAEGSKTAATTLTRVKEGS